jgi:excisionase family DNA binding protein
MCGMEKLLNTTETAERLGISARRVLQLIETGKLSAQKIGRDYAISAQSLDAVKIHGKAGRPPKAKAEDAPATNGATTKATAKKGEKK